MGATLPSRGLAAAGMGLPGVDSGWANRLPLRSVGVVFADRGEPVLGVAKLACDHLLDVGVKRGVRPEDELAQHRHQGTVFAGQRDSFGPVV
jgi:hypothetical protein